MTASQTISPSDHLGPLRVLFVITSMPIGGAETLLVNLIRRLDRDLFRPEICCLKERGPLGEIMAREVPVHSQMLSHKFDFTIYPRLADLMRRRQVDAVVTVGAGDKMFWGRLAARRAGVPVVISALHSTGWPDSVSALNRWLSPITDAFVAVARQHGRHLVERERFPAEKVRVIPNGVDTGRFQQRSDTREKLRDEWGVEAGAAVCGIVAALRAEKNHEMFLDAAATVFAALPSARFVIVGDGPRRGDLEKYASSRNLENVVKFVGARNDIPACLSAMDLFSLTSHNEANPVSILEAMSAGLPVVAPNVGSISETVEHGATGYLIEPGDVEAAACRWRELLEDESRRLAMGEAGRRRVEQNWSLAQMVSGYEDLIVDIYQRKAGKPQPAQRGEPSLSV